jgi:hypothetical protein
LRNYSAGIDPNQGLKCPIERVFGIIAGSLNRIFDGWVVHCFHVFTGVGMSNLSNALQLNAIHSQLPVTAYRAAVQRVPPPPGHHAQRPRQTASNIVCPLHRWTYDLDGQLLGAPHSRRIPLPHLGATRRAELERPVVRGQRPRRRRRSGEAGPARRARLQRLHVRHVEVHECDYNWKTFIEVYLEDYHVAPFHPGLGSFVSCDDLSGNSATGTRADGRRAQGLARRAARRTASGTTRAALPRRQAAASSARSGWSTTPTSWSSGIRTCWWSRR